MKTFFICLVLTGGSICFSKDTNEMVLEPIESMIHKIRKISTNPIDAMEENEKDEYLQTVMIEEKKRVVARIKTKRKPH